MLANEYLSVLITFGSTRPGSVLLTVLSNECAISSVSYTHLTDAENRLNPHIFNKPKNYARDEMVASTDPNQQHRFVVGVDFGTTYLFLFRTPHV